MSDGDCVICPFSLCLRWISPSLFAGLPSLFLFPALQLYSFDFSLFVHDCTIPWLTALGVQYISGCAPHRLLPRCLNERLCGVLYVAVRR